MYAVMNAVIKRLINKRPIFSSPLQTVSEILTTGRRGSSQESSGQTSPDPRSATFDSGFFTDSYRDGSIVRHQRAGSKKVV